MKRIFSIFLILTFFSISPISGLGFPLNPLVKVNLIKPYNMQNYDDEINHVYQTILRNPSVAKNIKLNLASGYFLGSPYYLFPMGEGPMGEFDQDPVYRTDVFDCMTYVEMVLGLINAHNLTQFQQVIKKIRYHNGLKLYVYRNHFVTADWNPNNQHNGYISDITGSLQLPYKIKVEKINKPNWYLNKQISDLALLQQPSKAQLQQKVRNFQGLSSKVSTVKVSIKYIPLSVLFTQSGQQLVPHWSAFKKIPAGTIIEIVNANDDSAKNIPNTVVKHMGFLIKTPQGLMFREASRLLGKVSDVPIASYLASYWQVNQANNDTGINVESVL